MYHQRFAESFGQPDMIGEHFALRLQVWTAQSVESALADGDHTGQCGGAREQRERVDVCVPQLPGVQRRREPRGGGDAHSVNGLLRGDGDQGAGGGDVVAVAVEHGVNVCQGTGS